MLPAYVQQQLDDYRARAQRAENQLEEHELRAKRAETDRDHLKVLFEGKRQQLAHVENELIRATLQREDFREQLRDVAMAGPQLQQLADFMAASDWTPRPSETLVESTIRWIHELETKLEASVPEKSVAHVTEQIDRLAQFIINEVEGYPCENEGACDTAIRIICDLQQASADCPERCRGEMKERLDRAEELLRQRERTALRAQGLYTALKAKLREILK